MTDGVQRPIQAIVVAPYAAVRAGLRALLADAPDIDVVAEASGSGDLEQQVATLRAQVVVADPAASDTGRLLSLLATTDLSAVWLSESREALAHVANAGLNGWAWLPRQAEGGEIAGAVRAAAAGLAVIDRAAASELIARGAAAGLAPGHEALTASNDDNDVLTPREREVLQLIANGLPNKVIAVRLGVSLHTVKFHVASILSKLDAESRTEAVTMAARRGLVSL